MNSQAELEENLGAVAKDDKLDERLLNRYLEAAQGREKLREMLEDPALDIRHYAKRALND